MTSADFETGEIPTGDGPPDAPLPEDPTHPAAAPRTTDEAADGPDAQRPGRPSGPCEKGLTD